MAALISAANAYAYCDKMAAVYEKLLATVGSDLVAVVDGTARDLLDRMRDLVLGLDVYEQEIDLLSPSNDALDATSVEAMMVPYKAAIEALSGHFQSRGSSVDSSIIDFDTFFAYYNGGSGGSKFSAMLTPAFATLYNLLVGSSLSPAGVMSPGIHPLLDSSYTNGMATKDVAGTFTAGEAVDNTLYSEVVPVVEVVTTFSGGSAAPTVTITGVDDEGNACTYGPITVTGGNNPAAALSGITVTPSVATTGRQTVAVSSATGIVRGSVLTINSGLDDEEVIVVEAVAGSDITAVFKKLHAGGATVDGNTSTAAGNASTGSGRRLRSISAITLGLSSHAAGKVRIAGRQDRVAY